MKRLLKRILLKLVTIDWLWKVLRPFAELGSFLSISRNSYKNPPRKQRVDLSHELAQSLVVKNGPFKGLKYPGMNAVGSMLYPKLIGSYEKELWPYIEASKKKGYTEIIDVGSAEGYYAIGFAVHLSNAKVYAYDTDKNAQRLCSEMAAVNNVKDRVIVSSELTPDALTKFCFTGRVLIICDCEGFEKQLFTHTVVQNLKNCDLIIEMHDFLDIEISTYLKELFSHTHTIQTVKSTDDIEKALTYDFPEIRNLTLQDKREILAERRPSIMQWLICTSN